MKMKTGALAIVLVVVTDASVAFAADVPNRSVPPAVMMEVRVVESEFKAALASDCAPDRCFVKGCAYEAHITLDQPRESSMPGLPTEDGPGSVVAQDYLTRVRCEFTHEGTVRSSDVAKLARRLEKRLSRGWMTVAVVPEPLEAIPKSLAKADPNAEEEEEKPKEAPVEPLLPPEPVEFTAELALMQLWETLLPHAPWMTALLLSTLMIFILIWAGRRLGTPSLEEKMLEAQMANGGVEEPPPPVEEPVVVEAPPPPQNEQDEAFAEEQERVWNERLDKLAKEDDDIISRLLREWLKMGDYAMLARAMLVFGDRVSRAFEAAPELALKKVAFASYFRDVDESTLPSRARFFRDLNQQSMASLLLSQEDVQLYRTLREDFGSSGFVSLMKDLPTRYSALLFALADYDQQQEVAALLSPELRKSVASELVSSTRISLRESAHLALCIEAVRHGDTMPPAPAHASQHEHGPALDSATALSILLPHMSSADRAELFTDAQKKHGGALPHWHEDIVFSHMLAALPVELRNDLLLEIDIRGLAAWLQTQQPAWRKAFVKELSEPLQKALSRNPAATTRADVVRYAKQGHRELVTALKGAYARGGVRFVELVS
jgi:hypothetical protein